MHIRKETPAAVLFLALLLGMCCYVLADAAAVKESILTSYRAARPENPTVLDKIELTTAAAESAVNTSADRAHFFIELYGGVQRLAGRRLVRDVREDYQVARLRDGALQFVSMTPARADMSESADYLMQFHAALEADGTPLLVTIAPQKIAPGSDALPVGLAEYGNEAGSDLMALTEGVPFLDFRQGMTAEDYENDFFKTDHHWNIEGAFQAFCKLAAVLPDYGFSVDSAWTDWESYEKTVYEDSFLGSQGKRVGTLYAGLDDLTVIEPKFDTDFVFSCPTWGIDRAGPMGESILFPERLLETDYYAANPYTLYAGGDYPVTYVTNNLNPDGGKIFLLRDSFACAMTPFLSLCCHELIIVDTRYYSGSILELVRAEQPDLVLFLYCTSSYRNGGFRQLLEDVG